MTVSLYQIVTHSDEDHGVKTSSHPSKVRARRRLGHQAEISLDGPLARQSRKIGCWAETANELFIDAAHSLLRDRHLIQLCELKAPSVSQSHRLTHLATTGCPPFRSLRSSAVKRICVVSGSAPSGKLGQSAAEFNIMPSSRTAATTRLQAGWGNMDYHLDYSLKLQGDAAWILCEVVFAAKAACTDPGKVTNVAALKGEVARAKSSAGELRHLDELMDHEKY